MNSYPNVKLKELLKQIKEPVDVTKEHEYNLVGVKWYAEGLFIRETKLGSDIKANKLFVLRKGRFVYNRLFAWKGSFAIVQETEDLCYVSNEFPTFQIDSNQLDLNYLLYYFSRQEIWDEIDRGSKGISSVSRKRFKEVDFLDMEIPLPSIDVQNRIGNRIKSFYKSKESILNELDRQREYFTNLLLNKFEEAIKEVKYERIGTIAPITRRKIEINDTSEYPELGIRSFGKGTFLKPSILGKDLGSKKIYEIHKGDLLFSNVFAWEGAIALVGDKGHGRYGSHRFISCVCNTRTVLPEFLHYYFLSDEGLGKIRKASPGSTSRNKTLGLKKLENIEVPIPDIKIQREFVSLKKKVDSLIDNNNRIVRNLDLLNKALLNGIFEREND